MCLIILKKLSFFFFKFVFKNCIFPENFNISFIKPIIKDYKKSNSDLKNLRPISISNTLSQIFERILLECIPDITNTHDNQFGYKNKTGCIHALFCVKETISNLIENKKRVILFRLMLRKLLINYGVLVYFLNF
jgi:hypothetical protein